MKNRICHARLCMRNKNKQQNQLLYRLTLVVLVLGTQVVALVGVNVPDFRVRIDHFLGHQMQKCLGLDGMVWYEACALQVHGVQNVPGTPTMAVSVFVGGEPPNCPETVNPSNSKRVQSLAMTEKPPLNTMWVSRFVMHVLHDPWCLWCITSWHHWFLEGEGFRFPMPILHEKCPPRVQQTGLLLLLMQYRFFSNSKTASQVTTFQTQTFLHLILAANSPYPEFVVVRCMHTEIFFFLSCRCSWRASQIDTTSCSFSWNGCSAWQTRSVRQRHKQTC